MKKLTIITLLLVLSRMSIAQSDTISLTLSQAIAMAQERSYDARAAHHALLAAEWSYKFYKANHLPTLTLSSEPYLNRVISKITLPDGSSSFVEQNQLSTNAALGITQNIAFTGGQFFLKSTLQRQDEFEQHRTAYNSQPVVIGYQQSLFGYNSLKWEQRTEPLRYEAAKKTHRENMELIASNAANYFFSLASAQTELYIAEYNYASADTLNRYALGRYKIGTITESEMLQLELNKITAEANVLNARSNLEDAMLTLCSYLTLDGDVILKAEIESKIPICEVDISRALALAHAHNPDLVNYELRRQESLSNLAQSKANSRLKADLYLQFGLSQTADELRKSYHSPQDQQYASIGLSLPILDWGRGKGRVKIAESNAALVETQIEQACKEFDINIGKMVRQFNLQSHRVEVSYRSMALAQQRYNVARQLYILGKSTILDLNAATSEKDAAQRGHITALKTFWALYYALRSFTGGHIFDNNNS